jgi:hypothetical protein
MYVSHAVFLVPSAFWKSASVAPMMYFCGTEYSSEATVRFRRVRQAGPSGT